MTIRPTYAGIGSRETPKEIQDLMSIAASQLEENGFILRSGAAPGADTAFERGVRSSQNWEIFIPWSGFQNRTGRERNVFLPHEGDLQGALDYARKYHPAWNRLTDPVKMLMARNTYQVLGLMLDAPAKFILCWTPKGSGSGGTGQAIRIAKACGIPVFDMGGMSTDEINERVNALI